MTRRRDPRPLAAAIASVTAALAPRTLLAGVQQAWPGVVGDAIAAHAQPVSERDGVIVVQCSPAVWAQELDLMGPTLVERLNEALGGERITALRCRATVVRGAL